MPAQQIKPSLVERLQSQVAAYEREVSRLRQADAAMQLRLHRAVAESDTLKAARNAIATTVLDLRRQLEVRAKEVETLHAEMELLRASLPPSVLARAAESKPAATQEPGTRFSLLEVDD